MDEPDPGDTGIAGDDEVTAPPAPIPFAAAAAAMARRDEDQAKFEGRVLRAFVRDGRLASIPAQDRKRQVVLRWLLDTCFPDTGPIVERDVNMRLALRHPDVAALRRYLVEAGLMTRDHGVYRRATAPAPEVSSEPTAEPTAD